MVAAWFRQAGKLLHYFSIGSTHANRLFFLQLLVVAQRNVHEHAPVAVSKQMTSASVSSLLLSPCSACVKSGRMHAEMKSLVVERDHGIADDLVGQLAHRFAD